MAALSPAAQRGLKLFVGRAGCRLCHPGPRFTDDEFHDLGLAPRGGGTRRDPGRYGGLELLLQDPFRASGRYSDAPDGARARELEHLVAAQETWGQFKTPSLRNVARTAPYGHDGKFAALEDVLRFYSTLEGAASGHHGERVLRPLGLDEREIADLVAFLGALTDESLDPALLGPPGARGGGG
jgi:cytochrome c peroxidase